MAKTLSVSWVPKLLPLRLVSLPCRTRLIVGLALLSAIVMTGCGAADAPTTQSASPAPASVRLADPDAFAAAILEPTRVTINVHVPFEGNIDGTDLSLPFDQIVAQSERLPADRRTGLAVYCRSGPMSAIAIDALRSLGYTDIVELRGGMRAWQADGRQLTGA
jgi:rhodanese-related sulfurtransferase